MHFSCYLLFGFTAALLCYVTYVSYKRGFANHNCFVFLIE